MAISFADAPGNLFNRLGKLGNLISEADAYQAAQLSNMTDTVNGVVAQYNSEPDIQALVGSAYIGQLNGVGSTVGGLCQSVAQQTMSRVVFRDQPQLFQTLTNVTTTSSISEVIRQMKVQGATVLAMTVAATPDTVSGQPGPHFTGTGNGVVVASVRRPFDGAVVENAFAEDLLLTCSSDSYGGNATAGNEDFSLTGTGSNGAFEFDWPLGSNASTSLQAVDGTVSNGSGNVLTNSGFDDWTSSVPDKWELVVGTAGTSIVEETSIVYGTGSSLAMVGDGSTLTQIRQRFDNAAGGSSDALEPSTQYSVNLFARRDGVAAAAGVLTVDLVDQNGNVVQDNGGTANSFTVDLTTLTVDFQSKSGSFRTPSVLPDELYLRVRQSTALTSGRTVYLDCLGMGLMTKAYQSGPYIGVHSGSIPFETGDYSYTTVTNSRGAGGTLDTWQTLFSRLFPDVYSLEILLPSSSAPSISDSLIG